jgi:hypothetical protein
MIREKKPTSEVIVDLTGPEGNAFTLLAYAKRWSKDLGLDFAVVKSEMTSGDYENLLVVIDKYFGEFVIFER